MTGLWQLVWDRARSCCEYCQMPQEFDPLLFEVDHIIAQKHHGPTIADNLALACFQCNNHKGANIAGVDPVTGQVVQLFDPRHDHWSVHFSWNGAIMVGETPAGRASIDVLNINLLHRVAHRSILIDEGVFPVDRVAD